MPLTPLDTPGMYGWQDDSHGPVNYWFFKRDDANDRCMLLYVQHAGAPAYGLKPSSGYAVGKVILSNSAADCDYAIDASPVPMGQTVEASCGDGKFEITLGDGLLATYNINAHFEFPPTYGWVPASDTYCFSQPSVDGGPGYVPGC